VEILHAGFVPRFERDRTPQSGGDIARRQVPAVLVARLAGENAYLVGAQSAQCAEVVVGGETAAVGRHVFEPLHDRGVKNDVQAVVPGFQQSLDVAFPCAEHVARAVKQFAVQPDVGIAVHSFEDEPHVVVRRQFGCVERAAVLPVGLVDPLQIALAAAVERIGDLPVCQQVGMHGSGDCGREPFAESVLPEFPSLVQFGAAGGRNPAPRRGGQKP
jgi:hypothetical protein